MSMAAIDGEINACKDYDKIGCNLDNIMRNTVSVGLSGIKNGVVSALFDTDVIQSSKNEFDAETDNFGAQSDDLAKAVMEKIGPGAPLESAALYGTAGNALFSIWDANVSTLSEFKANFENWSETVTVITATQREFSADLGSIYRTTASEYVDTTTTSNLYESMNSETSSEADDVTGELELSANYSGNYFIQRGDKCTVYGEEVTFFGRDGSYNYYTDANGNVFVDGDGRLISLDVHQNNFNIGYLKDGSAWYGAVTATSGNASSMNLPEEITVSSNSNFDAYGMQEYVDPSSISIENYSTYDTNEGFRQDLNSANPPKVLEFDHALESPLWDIVQPDINPGSNGKVTLVYDERAGMYYQLDDNGAYVRGMYGYTPEELSEYDVEKHK